MKMYHDLFITHKFCSLVILKACYYHIEVHRYFALTICDPAFLDCKSVKILI